VILQEFTAEQFHEAEAANGFDWRKALGSLVLAWCSSQDPERGLVTFKKFGFLSFTLRVKHLGAVIEIICGPTPAQDRP
jgi:hypothetical protein